MTLPPFANPTILVARPKSASEEFVTALAQMAGAHRSVICPAFELVSTRVKIPDFEAAVFTSRAGVSFAPNGQGRVAYCVGNATALAAQQFGYTPISADGSAADLCTLILAAAPPQTLLHIRGENSAGDVMITLLSAGLQCEEAIAYRKCVVPIDSDVLANLKRQCDVVIPAFSTETVSILGKWPFGFERCHVVAISEAVAQESLKLDPASIAISPRPNLSSMVAATARLIA